MSEASLSQRSLSARSGIRHVRPRSVRIRSAIGYVLLCLVALGFLSPLIYMVATSLKIPSEVFTTPPKLIGSTIDWHNYADAFTFAPFGRYLLNSLFVATMGTIINTTLAAISGYAFSRLHWRGRGAVFTVFLATLMIPQEVLVVPAFVMMQKMGWIDTYKVLIIPWAFSAFGAFMARQFFMTVPSELDDAAKVDGAGPIRIFWSVMLPLARPTLAVLSVFSFIGFWNSFLWPLITINNVDTYGTVPLGLEQFFGQQGSQWNLVMAASVMTMLPMIVLVVLLQRHLVRGIATSGFGGR